MKKGFTLVELLAVIVLLSLITVIGSVGVKAVKNYINKNMLESTIFLIESDAVRYGSDHKNAFKETDICENFENRQYCREVTVQELLDRGYIQTKETDLEGNKVLINNTLDETDNGYYLNESKVYIYMEDNNFYAKLIIE